MITDLYFEQFTTEEELIFCFIKTIHTIKDYMSNHCHNYNEINYIARGNGRYFINNKVFNANPGDIFVMKYTDFHKLVIDSSEFIIYVIHFSDNYVCPEPKNVQDLLYLKAFGVGTTELVSKLDVSNPKIELVRKAFLDIDEEIKDNKLDREIFIRNKFLEMLAVINRYFIKESFQTNNNFTDNEIRIMSNVLKYINFYLFEEITLENLAAVAHMSPNYFSTLFKKMYGKSPLQFVLEKRIEKSTELLKNTDKGIVEIANICGFNHSSNFYKAFKKITGVVPTEYRKRNVKL